MVSGGAGELVEVRDGSSARHNSRLEGFLLAGGAAGVLVEPERDAVGVELVGAGQRFQLLLLLKVLVAERAGQIAAAILEREALEDARGDGGDGFLEGASNKGRRLEGRKRGKAEVRVYLVFLSFRAFRGSRRRVHGRRGLDDNTARLEGEGHEHGRGHEAWEVRRRGRKLGEEGSDQPE